MDVFEQIRAAVVLRCRKRPQLARDATEDKPRDGAVHQEEEATGEALAGLAAGALGRAVAY